MNDINTNNNSNISRIENVLSRLVIKNIPENFSNEQLNELITKNFENKIKDVNIVKLEHKYHSKNNKICFLTAENLETRKQIFSFFSGFEMVDPKGFKQKLTVVDCLYQNPNQNKVKVVKDVIENTIEQSNIIKTLIFIIYITIVDHFQKFKEYFTAGKLVDFKNDESKCINYFIINISLRRNF
jgi:hypothetical protein